MAYSINTFIKHKYLILVFLATLCFFKLVSADGSNLLIKDAWIAEAPPVSKVMAAYMTFQNIGSDNIEIISAESDVYSSIEFHQTIYENGIARMIRNSSLKIPANSNLDLKQNESHFMLLNPKKPLKQGDKVSIKLTTKGNRTIIISVPVIKDNF